MNDTIYIAIGFISGAAATIGTYLGVMQYRRSLPSLKIMATCCSFRLTDDESKYTCAFHFWLQNQTNTDYAITDIQWRPRSRRLRKKIQGHSSEAGWHRLQFDGVLNREHWSHRKPLVFAPYEHKHLVGYWKQMWTSDGQPQPEFWKEYPEDATTFDKLVEELHDNRAIYQVTFADGNKLRYKGRPEHGS
jgi:hypothetical protein